MTQATVGKRICSVIQIAGTKYVCLPKEYAIAHEIKKGDKIEVLFDGSIIYRLIRDEDQVRFSQFIEKEIANAKKMLQTQKNRPTMKDDAT
jgi:bifunctional DNA-binding transcriptional regulator/antitoxin component of YhaV-PrlF toxin-antitoxin module